jgi:hypothetical protein
MPEGKAASGSLHRQTVHVNHTGTGSERIHRRMTCQLV